MRRPGLTAALAFALPLILIFGLLFFVVLTDQDDCLPAGFDGADLPANPVAVSNPGPLNLRVATWNTLFANSTNRVLGGLRAVSARADVIGVQELSSPTRRHAVAAGMARQGWAVSDGNNAVQILYDARKYRLLAQGSEKVLDVVRIESGTAGTSIGPKSVQWVELQDRATGGVGFVVNHHIVPDIDRKGHPRAGAPKRLEVYRTQMAAMLSLVAKLRSYGPVAVTGDHNVDARADLKVRDPMFPAAVMGHAGLASNWAVLGTPREGTQTSGRRLIDYVWLTQASGRFVSQRILGAYGSDHHAVVTAIASTGVRGTPGGGTPAPTPPPLPTSLTVQVGGQQVTLGVEQIGIAATVIAEGKAAGVPARGWIVALAAAGAESGIRNLDHGDRDSLGPWQMRPSTGWGTPEQIRTVPLAARAFFGVADHTHNPGLLDVDGWEQMTIAQAAQAVERSAFPDAYTRWADAARTLVERLGDVNAAPGAGSCPANGASDLEGACPATGLPAESVLSPDGLLVLRCVLQHFPAISNAGTYPGHEPDETRAVDIMIPGWNTAAGKQLGNQIAAWVKDHQRQLGVQYVIWDGQIWNIERDREGWRRYFDAGNPDPNRAHRNHVHVSVYGDKGTGPDPVPSGAWHTPIGEPSRIGCGYGCYRGHTGQDFPAPTGTPVYAAAAGTVIRSESITTRGTCTTLPICGSSRVSYGNLIVIQIGSGDVTAWYAHLSARQVSVGQTVQPGQIIGAVGYEGHVIPKGPGGAHLHFEIRRGGRPVDPLPYLRGKGVQP